MANSKQEIANLFNERTRYRVPRYQRRYVWHEPNWEAIWRDATQLQEGKNHFTGTIVKKTGDMDNSYIVVDGQQRLITFQIIFSVIRDLWGSGQYTSDVGENPYNQVKSKLYELTELGSLGTGSFRKSSSSDSNDDNVEYESYPYRIFITKKRERDAFESVISGNLWNDKVANQGSSRLDAFNSLFEKGFDKGKQTEQHRIITAYGYFGMKITEYLTNEDSEKLKPYEKLMKLLQTLIYGFFAYDASLGEEDMPQQAYKSINDTGVTLDEFDLLRNDLFLRAKKEKNQDDFYNTYWSIFGEDDVENEFWEKSGTTDKFLKDFLMAKLGPKAQFGNRLFHHAYKGEYSENLEKELGCNESSIEFVKKEFSELSKYAKVYKEMEDPKTDIGRRRQFYKDLNGIFENLNLVSLPPFMLYVACELELDIKERDRVYQVLESYVLRCQLRHGVNEEKITTQKIDDLFDLIIKGEIDIGKHKTAETVAQYLASTKPGREWLNDEKILNGLTRVGFQLDNTPIRTRVPVWGTLIYIFYRIECKMQRSEKGFKDFLKEVKNMLSDTRLKQIRPQSKGETYRVSYSIGNLTFYNGYLKERQLLSQRRKILLSKPNSNLKLNQTMKKYENLYWWDEWAIKDREKILLTHFREIWPSPKYYIGATATDHDSDSRPGWISRLQSPFVIMFYEEEPQEGQEIPTTSKKDILFVCSSESWKELYPHIKIIDNVRTKQLAPIQQQSEQLNINDTFLKFAREEQVTVYLTTRYGHLLEGTIEEFSQDVIQLQISEELIIVFRSGLLEFTTDILYEGIVKSWRPDDLFGFIECEKNLPRKLQDIEVKSDFLDPSILSRKLLSDLQVNFNLKIIWKNGNLHYEAHNVKPITTGRIHRGKIKSFRPEKGSGFLELDDYQERIYINKSQVLPQERSLLKEGQQVEFNIAKTVNRQSSVAINVKMIR